MPAGSKIEGFSRLSRREKADLIAALTRDPVATSDTFDSHLHHDPELRQRYERFSENTLSNYYLPFGIAPNFLINDRYYHVPMVTEESSVVAAASHAAKFWSDRGGFKAVIEGREKKGQVHFTWSGNNNHLRNLFTEKQTDLLASVEDLISGMVSRGGGISSLNLVDRTALLPGYYQLDVSFLTADAMGANFINSVLETIADRWSDLVGKAVGAGQLSGDLDIIMSILSNYTPESRVLVTVETQLGNLAALDPGSDGKAFAEKYIKAVKLAEIEPYRAVTHNKGIFNGVDAVVLATGNDFRAVEACGHAYAARKGQYGSLSFAEIENGIFRTGLRLPMAVGTVGGLTRLHPLAAKSLEILGYPGSDELMMIIAAAGLANNFSAIRSLITSGIQKGHMKMHLTNILLELGATPEEQALIASRFAGQTISRRDVSGFLEELRQKNGK